MVSNVYGCVTICKTWSCTTTFDRNFPQEFNRDFPHPIECSDYVSALSKTSESFIKTCFKWKESFLAKIRDKIFVPGSYSSGLKGKSPQARIPEVRSVRLLWRHFDGIDAENTTNIRVFL